MNKPCEYYDKENGGCGLPDDAVCSARRITFTKDEIEKYEKVRIPIRLQQIGEAIGTVQNPYHLFTAASYESVSCAFQIMDRVTPLYDRGPDKSAASRLYLENSNAIEADAIMLTSLFATINTLAAVAEADTKHADHDRKMVQADKMIKVRAAFENNIRRGRSTERGIEALVEADSDVREAKEIYLQADKSAKMLRAIAESIIEHVNMLKRRVDGLRLERKYTPS